MDRAGWGCLWGCALVAAGCAASSPSVSGDGGARPTPDAGFDAGRVAVERDGGVDGGAEPTPDGGPDGGPADTMAIEDFLAEVDLLWARFVFDCVSPSFATFVRKRAVAPVLEAVARGRLAFDPVAAERCLQAARASSCLDFPGDVRCEDALHGRVEAGDVCFLDEECGPAATCGPIAESCGGLCRPLPGEGDRCDGPSRECQAGLFCWVDRSASPPTSECRPRLDDGEACFFSDQCDSRRCRDRVCTRPIRRAAGERCDRFYGQSACDDPTYFCDASYTCVPRADLGEACESGGCLEGICRPASEGERVCVLRAGPLEACDADVPCIGNHLCVDGTCLPLTPEGHPCGIGCAYGSFCVLGVCGTPLDPGRRCDFIGDLRCANGTGCVLSDVGFSRYDYRCVDGC